MTATRIQHRATCPICGNQQAIRKNGTMVPHGYTRPEGWGMQVGDCRGTGRPHYGTPEGREVVREQAENCENEALRLALDMADVQRGTGKVYEERRNSWGRYRTVEEVAVEEPTERQRRTWAVTLEHRLLAHRRAAHVYAEKVAAWKPAAPVAVTVERRGPVLHLAKVVRGYNAAACCTSAYAAQRFAGGTALTTTDPDKVTCTRCRKAMEH